MRNTVGKYGFVSDGTSDDGTQPSFTVSAVTTFEKPVYVTTVLTATIDTTRNMLHVDKSGSDTTGDGTLGKPYLTVAKALSVIPTGSLALDNTYSIQIGVGQYEETTLTVPSYVGIYGSGTGTTKVKASSVGTPVFDVTGARVRLERMTILGRATGSSNIGVRSNTGDIDYIDAPRLYNLTVRQCDVGIQVTSASSCVCFDVRSWDNTCGFQSTNGNEFDLYECYAYQLAEARPSGTIGVQSICESTDQYVFLYSFNTWNNEVAIQAAGTGPLKGGLVYGANHSYESEGITLQCYSSADMNFADIWSKNVVDYDIDQKSATAHINIRNAQMDFSKFNIYNGGELEVKITGVDSNDNEIFRMRGAEPAVQLYNLNLSPVSGGLRRIANEVSHLCIERNTHPSGTFVTKVEDVLIDTTGSVSIGDIVAWNILDVSGTAGIREGGAIRLYVPYTVGPYFTGLVAHTASATSPTYMLPVSLPGIQSYLCTDTHGHMSWSAGVVTSGTNLAQDFGLCTTRSGQTLQFKALAAGSNITLSSGSNSITIDASASGEANTASNLETDWGLYKQKVGVDLQFKVLTGSSRIQLTSASNTITIATDAEINTASNLQTDFGLYSTKSGSDLRFKAITGSANIQLTSGANVITIATDAEINTASNLADFGPYSSKSGSDLRFKGLVAGTNITLTSGSNTITIDASASGEANTASNVAEFGPFKQKAGIDLEFKGFVAGANITITSGSDTITIDASASGEANTASNVAEFGLYKQKVGVDLEFKGLVAGSNITISSGSNTVTIDASASGEANTASNLAEFGPYASKSGVDLRFKGIAAGTGIAVSSGSTAVTITSADTASNLQTDFGLYSSKVGADFQFKAITGSARIQLTSGSNAITISTDAEINTASNLAEFGPYASKSGSDLRFKGLTAGTGVTITSGSTAVTISSEVLSGTNYGGGLEVYNQKSGTELQFRTIETPTGSLGTVLSSSYGTNTIQIVRKSISRVLYREDDFTTTSTAGVMNWTVTTNGTGAAISPSTEGIDTNPANAMGVFQFYTGTNASGRAALTTYASATRLDFLVDSIMEWRVSHQTLSTAAQEYATTVGWMDNPGAGDQVDGVYFMYDRLNYGDVWVCCAASNSSRTKSVTAVAPKLSTAGFQRLRIVTNLSCTRAQYYIDDVLVGTITTNLPNSSGRSVGFGAKIEKSAGSGGRYFYTDYITVQCEWAAGAR